MLSNVLVDSRKTVPNNLLFKIPRVGWDADFPFDVDFRDVEGDWVFEADLRGLVLVELNVSTSFG